MPSTSWLLPAVPVALFSGAALFATAGAFAPGADAASAAKATATAASLLSTVLANAQKASAVHITVTSAEGTEHLSVSGNDGTSSGTETMTLKQGSKTEHVSGRYVDNAVYFKANKDGLTIYLGVKTSDVKKYANHWLSLKSTDGEFTSAASSMSVSTTLRELSLTNPTLVKGTVLKGSPSSGTSTSGSSATLYITASGTPLPVAYLQSGETQGHKASGQITFTHWNKHFSVAAPGGAATAATVIGSASASTGSSGSSTGSSGASTGSSGSSTGSGT
jgi:hypothetical protein